MHTAHLLAEHSFKIKQNNKTWLHNLLHSCNDHTTQLLHSTENNVSPLDYDLYWLNT